MKQTRAKHLLAFFIIAAGCSAAEGTAKIDGIAVQLPVLPTAPAKPTPVPIPTGAVVVSDSSYDPKPAAPTDAKPDPAAEAKAAAEAEQSRAAEEASAFAKGEGERYAKRQKAYEAARSLAPRPPVEPAKRTSIAELQMPDGRYVVMAGNDRRVFASKAEAAPYLAGLKQEDRPIVIEAPKRK